MHRGWLLPLVLTSLTVPAFGAEELDKLLEQRLNSESTASSQQEQAGIAKGKREAVIAEGEAVIRNVMALQGVAERWDAQMREVLTSDVGRALAQDAMTVEDFVQLQGARRFSLGRIEGLRRQAQSLLMPIQAAPDGSTYTPSEALIVELRTVGQQAEEGMLQYQQLQARWRVLVQRGQGVSVDVGVPTLAARIDQVQDDRAKQEWEAQHQARAQAMEEQRKRIEEAEAAKIAAETRLKVQAMEDETRAKEEDAARRREAEAQERFVARAMSPETLSRFQPFLAPGRRLLARDSCRWGAESLYEQSVLYSDMLQCNTFESVKRFVAHANGKNNDRPKWPKPQSDAEWRAMEQRLQEFKQYAPIWMEKGILLAGPKGSNN